MMKKFTDFAHKASSVVAALALVASNVPALQPYQTFLVAVAGLLGGGAVAGSVATSK